MRVNKASSTLTYNRMNSANALYTRTTTYPRLGIIRHTLSLLNFLDFSRNKNRKKTFTFSRLDYNSSPPLFVDILIALGWTASK